MNDQSIGIKLAVGCVALLFFGQLAYGLALDLACAAWYFLHDAANVGAVAAVAGPALAGTGSTIPPGIPATANARPASWPTPAAC